MFFEDFQQDALPTDGSGFTQTRGALKFVTRFHRNRTRLVFVRVGFEPPSMPPVQGVPAPAAIPRGKNFAFEI